MTAGDERVAMVVGANGGIGHATVRAFGASGARVVVAARNAAALHALVHDITEHGGQALAVPTEVSDAAAVAQRHVRGRPVGNAGPAVGHHRSQPLESDRGRMSPPASMRRPRDQVEPEQSETHSDHKPQKHLLERRPPSWRQIPRSPAATS
jgi:short chain dehydrogenase